MIELRRFWHALRFIIGTFLYRFSEKFIKSTLKEKWKVCIAPAYLHEQSARKRSSTKGCAGAAKKFYF